MLLGERIVYTHTHTHTHTHTLAPAPTLTKAESVDSLLESLGVTVDPPSASDYVSPSGDPLQPPSWKTHANSSRDVLADVSFVLNFSNSCNCIRYT